MNNHLNKKSNFIFCLFSDKSAWDKYVIKHAPFSYFQSWNWGKIEEKSGKKVYRYALINKQSKKIYAVSQVIKVCAKRGTFLHVRHGPIFSHYTKKLFFLWNKEMISLARREKAACIRISPLVKEDMASFFSSFSYRDAPIHHMDGELSLLLNVQPSTDIILKCMRKNTRYLIRKGIRMGVIVKNLSDINQFLSLYTFTANRKHFIPHREVKNEYLIGKKEGMCDLLGAYYKGKLLSAAIIIYFGNQAIYRHAASYPTHIPASYVLQWEIIQRAKKKNIPYYNLFGVTDSTRKSHPWYGLTLFKKGFGGQIVHYLHAQDLPISPRYIVLFLIETVRRYKRGYY